MLSGLLHDYCYKVSSYTCVDTVNNQLIAHHYMTAYTNTNMHTVGLWQVLFTFL